MAKRRSKGEGSIYQRDDGLWVGQVNPPVGKRKYKYSKNQKVVRDWLLAQRDSITKGLWLDNERVRVGEFMDRFYTDVAVHTLRPKTLESYESIIRLHLKPEIGHLKLVSLTPAHLQALYSRKLESGLSNRSVQYIHAVIHRALAQAVKWGVVVRNVADAVDAPKVKRKAPEMLTEDQVKCLLAGADGRMRVILVLAATCGLRQGEILGLRYQDVSLEEGMLYVRHTTQTIYKRGIIDSEPKTEKGKRIVELPNYTVEVLKAYQSQTGESAGLIIHTSTGKPYAARNMIRDYESLLVKLGLPKVKFHSLRHFHATSLLKKNVNPKIVQERLGHSRISETLDLYSHMIPGIQKEAARKIDEIFK